MQCFSIPKKQNLNISIFIKLWHIVPQKNLKNYPKIQFSTKISILTDENFEMVSFHEKWSSRIITTAQDSFLLCLVAYQNKFQKKSILLTENAFFLIFDFFWIFDFSGVEAEKNRKSHFRRWCDLRGQRRCPGIWNHAQRWSGIEKTCFFC